MIDQPVVAVDQLCKTYRDGLIRRKRIKALRGVSFQVGRGEIFGLLGPNGAGKTTLVKILLGIVRKTRGSAMMLGRPAGDRKGRTGVGYLPEAHRIPQHLTGNTALEYFGQLSGMSLSEVKKKRPELLDMVGLTEWGRTPVKKYSKGMQQRLGLAQAMFHDPQFLVLDEPTDGIDPVGRTEIRAVLKRLKEEGKTVFLNSHLLQEIELVCDRVGILDKGLLRFVGSVDEVTSVSLSELIFDLSGDEAAARTAIAPHEITKWKTADENRHQVATKIDDQSEVDRVVDRLRAAGISVRSMSRRKLTLEEAFLKLLKESPTTK